MDKNISSLNFALKTLQYGEAELFTNFGKMPEDTCKDLWNNLIKKEWKCKPNTLLGLQTTANFKKALAKHREQIVNKECLRAVQIRYIQVGGKYKKDPFRDCVVHTHRWNKVYTPSV